MWLMLKDGRLTRAPSFGKKTLVTLSSVEKLLTPPVPTPKKRPTEPSGPEPTWASIRPRV